MIYYLLWWHTTVQLIKLIEFEIMNHLKICLFRSIFYYIWYLYMNLLYSLSNLDNSSTDSSLEMCLSILIVSIWSISDSSDLIQCNSIESYYSIHTPSLMNEYIWSYSIHQWLSTDWYSIVLFISLTVSFHYFIHGWKKYIQYTSFLSKWSVDWTSLTYYSLTECWLSWLSWTTS